MTFQQLQTQVLDLPAGERWALLKLLVESLQPTPPTLPEVTSTLYHEENSLAQYYGCIEDETFIRHPQPQQGDRQPIL